MTHHETDKVQFYSGLSKTASGWQACVLQLQDGRISRCRTYETAPDETDLQTFVASVRRDYPDQSLRIVMGCDDANVGFYRFEIPNVPAKQMPAVVAAQTEIHLPVAIDQMQTDWQIVGQNQSKADVVLAAARRSMLMEATAYARQVQTDAVALTGEATARALAWLDNKCPGDFNLLNVTDAGIKLLFVRNGTLVKTMTFDGDIAEAADEPTPAMTLLCLDIQNAISEYAGENIDSEPLYLHGPDTGMESIEAILKTKGISSSRLQIDTSSLACDKDPNLECLGLALIAYNDKPHYNLFNGLYRKQSDESAGRRPPKIKLLAAAVCLLFVIFAAISYGLDKYRLTEYEKQMNTPEFTQLLETHRLRTTIARQRINVPEIIEKINQSLPKNLDVVSLDIQRYRKIAVRGRCKDPKLMYALVESLGKCSGVDNVRISKQDFDEKKKVTVFTMTFDYRNFTDKKKAL